MSKKFTFQTQQEKDGWSAAIIRRVSSKKSVVSKQQSSFTTEEEARDWAEAELKSFLAQLSAKNKARLEQRQ
ncbi:MAG: hypothetical protein AseanaTS_00080 [Candidatus Pelagadaptatus aseana]|uniref:DUF3622 domain-containing protein n=1 Tax=Candidatus Pelagadaptatus aseana TaxID=3120508 RepID=UPI0039B14CF2